MATIPAWGVEPITAAKLQQMCDALTEFQTRIVALESKVRIAYKTANEIVNNSASAQDDNHLFLSVEASGVYAVESHIIYQSTTAADIYFSWSGPAGATFEWSSWGQSTGATTFEGVIKNEGRSISVESAHGGTGAPLTIRPTGLLVVGGTAGTFRLRWAQVVATAVDTTVFTGSWIKLTKVA